MSKDSVKARVKDEGPNSSLCRININGGEISREFGEKTRSRRI